MQAKLSVCAFFFFFSVFVPTAFFLLQFLLLFFNVEVFFAHLKLFSPSLPPSHHGYVSGQKTIQRQVFSQSCLSHFFNIGIICRYLHLNGLLGVFLPLIVYAAAIYAPFELQSFSFVSHWYPLLGLEFTKTS